MKIISTFLILCLIQVSLSAWFNTGVETTTSDAVADSEEEEDVPRGFVERNDRLQSDPEADDEELGTNDQNPDLQNQDEDSDGPKVMTKDTTEPGFPVDGQSNVDPNRPSDLLPPPDYSAVNARGYLPQCHGGQYQCQKTDPTTPTRCIPQEWRCNGLRDCEDNDDERGCSTDQLSRGRTQAKCTQDQYQCHGSGINSVPPHCIASQQRCDNKYDCQYGDDEANCQTQDRREDRREPPSHQNQIPRRNENNANTNDQNTGARGDPRDTYRPQPNDRKSEEYVQRLEWRDRCFRSCLKY